MNAGVEQPAGMAVTALVAILISRLKKEVGGRVLHYQHSDRDKNENG